MKTELVQAAVGSAREARKMLAQALTDERPRLTRDELGGAVELRLTTAIGALYTVELGGASRVLDGLRDGADGLRLLLRDLQHGEEGRATSEGFVAEVAQALAIVHPTRKMLARALGRPEEDGTAHHGPREERGGATPTLSQTESPSSVHVPGGAEPSLAIPLSRRRPSAPAGSDALAPDPDSAVALVRRVVRDPDEPERRREHRHSVEAELGFQSATNFYTGQTGDISTGGIFVATESLLPVGEKLTVSFVLPDGHQVTTSGEVAWIRDDPESPEESPAGFGIRFSELGDEDLRAIRRFARYRKPMKGT